MPIGKKAEKEKAEKFEKVERKAEKAAAATHVRMKNADPDSERKAVGFSGQVFLASKGVFEIPVSEVSWAKRFGLVEA